ncbi:hypothetical protein ILYODFUR_016759 [Ilyodon furcidens]|uniref:Uncharacterized protein n=1 Tax=Ilyodon furcidens TaxID=33524 RepID=A0ABV0V3M5_9TELE
MPAACTHHPLVPVVISVCFVCICEKERYCKFSHEASLSLSLTPTLLSPTHPDSESATVAALPEALAQWTLLELPPVLHDGWCLCVCLWMVSPFLFLGLIACFRYPHLQAECLSLLSVRPSMLVLLYLLYLVPLPPFLRLALQKVEAIVGLNGVGFCSPAAANTPLRPLQDKAVIAQGTAGLGGSSSKQICCNFICNWTLNWEQIEAAL